MKKRLFLILLTLSTASCAQVLPGPVCSHCGVYCDAAACEALGGGGKCYFSGDPLVSDPANCRPCSEITSCSDYRIPGSPVKVWTNLCSRDPCNLGANYPGAGCDLAPDLVCRACRDIRCDEYVPGGFSSMRCCTDESGAALSREDEKAVEDAVDEIKLMAEFWKADCHCSCGRNEKGEDIIICASALVPRSIENWVGLDIRGNKKAVALACSRQCGKNCGGYAAECDGSSGSCEECCRSYCSDDSRYGGVSKNECINACKSGCGYKKVVGDLSNLFFTVSGMVGVIMIVVHTLRLAASSDERERSEAKRSIVYILLALIIIALATSVVKLLIGVTGAAKPEPCKVPGLGAFTVFVINAGCRSWRGPFTFSAQHNPRPQASQSQV